MWKAIPNTWFGPINEQIKLLIMHDPMTVAFQIKSPFKNQKGYRKIWITIWHVDPETDGTDDSCGWFMRSRHGDGQVLDKIFKALKFEIESEHCSWYFDNGLPRYSILATVRHFYYQAAYIHFGRDWDKAQSFMRRYNFDIAHFAENPIDSLHRDIQQIPQDEKFDSWVMRISRVIYGDILRKSRPWYKHPRWHFWHWKITFPAIRRMFKTRDASNKADVNLRETA